MKIEYLVYWKYWNEWLSIHEDKPPAQSTVHFFRDLQYTRDQVDSEAMCTTLTRQEILDHIHSRKEHFRHAYRVKKIALIGSFARDEATPDSDIDLLVDLEENTPNIYELKQGLKQELEEQFHRPVEIASERYLKPYFRDPILRDAIVV